MATNLFEHCANPISGESFKAISIRPEAYVMEWKVLAEGYVPFEHIHLHQDEIFKVQQGELGILIDGKEHIVKAGDSITVTKGKAHKAFNRKAETLECIVEYRPALDYDTFMQCLIGLTNDGHIDKNGGASIPKLGYFLVKMKAQCMARPTNIPAPMFNIALRVFYLRGVLSGWGKLFDRYTKG